MQFQPLPTILQFRNNCVVSYKDTSQLNIVRNGCKDSLKQNNQQTVYTKNIDDLKKLTEIEDINAYADTYQYNYDLHNSEYLNPKGINKKELGTISANQMRKYKRVVENVVNCIYINPKTKDYKKGDYAVFLTLTLPGKQIHPDNMINKILVRLLENLKKTKNVLNYVWKAEPQENGNIHYHVILDKWIDKEYINTRWNKQINKLGYVDRYQLQEKEFFKNGFRLKHSSKLNKKQQLEAYKNALACDFTNPPSTQIHSLGKVKNIVSYIQKYMTKQEQGKRPITAKIFGYSRSAGKLDYPKIVYDGLSIQNQNDVDSILKNDLKYYENENIDTDYIKLYTGKVYEVLRNKAFRVWRLVKKHYATMKQRLQDLENKKPVLFVKNEVLKDDYKQSSFENIFPKTSLKKVDTKPFINWLESIRKSVDKENLLNGIDLKINQLSHI